MTPKLTNEQRAALLANPAGQPVEVHDEQSDRIYWLLAAEDAPRLWRQYVETEIDRGLDAIDRGEIVEWNPDALKARARDVSK